MKKTITLFIAALLTLSAAATTTYDFSSTVPAPWSSSVEPIGQEPTGRGVQWSKTDGTLTLAGCTNVTSVTVKASTNAADSYTITVKVGSATLGSAITVGKETKDCVFSGSALSGDIVVSFTKKSGAKSFYIKQIVVDGDVPAEADPTERLDPAYVYPADPIIIEPHDSLGKIGFDTVITNILIQCNNAAYYKTDLRVLANGVITFTATQAIKAIMIDGCVKQNFQASTTAGDITYVDASEDAVTAEPVLIIKNIDANTVSITCEKQIQMQKIYIYFDENPDAEIDQGGAGDDPSWPVTSTGSFPIVKGYFDTYYLSSYGSIDIRLLTNANWYIGDDGDIYGDGDGTYVVFEFYPDSETDLSGTYSIADETLDAEYSYYYIYTGGSEFSTGYASGTVTLAQVDDTTYNITYNLVDSIGTELSGTINGLVFSESSGGGGGDVSYKEVNVAGAIDDAAELEYDDMSDIWYYVSGYAVAVEPDVDGTTQTVYLADTPDGATNLFKVEDASLFDAPIQVGDYVCTFGVLYRYPMSSVPEFGLKNAYIWVEEDPLTALGEVIWSKDSKSPRFNIIGQKVPAGYKGVVIQNGKKYIVL